MLIKNLCAGSVAVLAIISLVGASLWQLAQFGGAIILDNELLSILRFSLIQASLSSALSLTLGIFLGRAYIRRRHVKFLRILSWVFNGSFLLPVLVAVFGLIAVHGINGWINSISPISFGRYIYGFTGIIIAHVFFNAPLAARLVATSLNNIPWEHWRLAQQLGMLKKNGWKRFWLLEYPYIKHGLLTASALIFLLCFTSFAIVLTLGGGLFSTLEVAIYQALRLQFEPTQAAFLALVQMLICASVACLLLAFGKQKISDITAGIPSSPRKRADADLLSAKITDIIVFIIATILIVPVLVSLPLALLDTQALAIFATPTFYKALGTSLAIAPIAALISTLLACALGCAARHMSLRLKQKNASLLFEIPSFLLLMTPPLTLSSGLFLWLYKLGLGSNFYALVAIVVIINALLVLPFTAAVVFPALHRIAAENDRLAFGLGLRGFKRWCLVEFPLLRRPLGLAFGLGSALAVGDVSAIALFGTQDFSNLPLLLYRLLGSYRFSEAGAVGVALCVVVFLLFFLGLRLGNFLGTRRYHVSY